MKWSKELPKVDGWYWMRGYDVDGSHDQAWPVEIIMGELYENDELIDWPIEYVEFQGPIHPVGEFTP